MTTRLPAVRPPGDDIAARLRAAHFDTVTQDDLREAADEIDRLRGLLADHEEQDAARRRRMEDLRAQVTGKPAEILREEVGR